jgi:hypothetical protein
MFYMRIWGGLGVENDFLLLESVANVLRTDSIFHDPETHILFASFKYVVCPLYPPSQAYNLTLEGL